MVARQGETIEDLQRRVVPDDEYKVANFYAGQGGELIETDEQLEAHIGERRGEIVVALRPGVPIVYDHGHTAPVWGIYHRGGGHRTVVSRRGDFRPGWEERAKKMVRDVGLNVGPDGEVWYVTATREDGEIIVVKKVSTAGAAGYGYTPEALERMEDMYGYPPGTLDDLNAYR